MGGKSKGGRAEAPINIEELELDEWDPSTMPDDCCCLMVGARHSGKSVLLTDIMYHKRKRLNIVVGMNPTEEANETLSQFTPPCCIFDEYDDEVIDGLVECQRRCRAKDRAGKKKSGYRPVTRKIGLVLDDCMAEKCKDEKGKKKKKVMQSDNIEKVFKLGRHYKFFFICAMQYIKDAPPSIRGNVDYIFVFDTNSGSEREKLHKEYFSMFKYKDFCKVFDACVGEKYNCIVLDVRKSRGARGQGIYYYKATDRTTKCGGEAFRVGDPVFWGLSHYYFKERTDTELDIGALRGIAFGKPAEDAKAPAPILGGGRKGSDKVELVVKRRPAASSESKGGKGSREGSKGHGSSSKESRDRSSSSKGHGSSSSSSRDRDSRDRDKTRHHMAPALSHTARPHSYRH